MKTQVHSPISISPGPLSRSDPEAVRRSERNNLAGRAVRQLITALVPSAIRVGEREEVDVAIEQVLSHRHVEGGKGRVGGVALVQYAKAGRLDEVVGRTVQVDGDGVGILDGGRAGAAAREEAAWKATVTKADKLRNCIFDGFSKKCLVV